MHSDRLLPPTEARRAGPRWGQGSRRLDAVLSAGSRPQVERRLRRVGDQLRAYRDDLRVTEEQLRQLSDEADDARLRALVSETPLAEKEHRRASRHVEKLRAHREKVLQRIHDLEAQQDELLDRLGST